MFSPTLVNEARAGINYIAPNSGGADKGLGNIAQTLGIAGVPTGLMLKSVLMAASWCRTQVKTQPVSAATMTASVQRAVTKRGISRANAPTGIWLKLSLFSARVIANG